MCPRPGLEDTPAVLSATPTCPQAQRGGRAKSWACSSVTALPGGHSAERLWLRVMCELVSGQRPQPRPHRVLYDCRCAHSHHVPGNLFIYVRSRVFLPDFVRSMSSL